MTWYISQQISWNVIKKSSRMYFFIVSWTLVQFAWKLIQVQIILYWAFKYFKAPQQYWYKRNAFINFFLKSFSEQFSKYIVLGREDFLCKFQWMRLKGIHIESFVQKYQSYIASFTWESPILLHLEMDLKVKCCISFLLGECYEINWQM